MLRLLDPQATAAVSIDFPEIAADPSRFLAIMAEQGFAVVTNVVDDVPYAEGLWASDLRAILDMEHSAETRALAEDPVHTWPADVPLGRPVEHGLAQGQLARHIRRNRNIRHCYEVLHHTKELVISTDSILFKRPTPPTKLREPWGHVDYHRDLVEHECFQSIVYLWDTDDESGTKIVWPGSHITQYEAVMDANPVPRLFSLIPEAMVQEYRAGACRVRIPKGAMIVWNSKLVHQGYDAPLAVPVKCALVASGVSGTHWAAVFRTHRTTRDLNNRPRGPSQEFGRVRLLHRAHLHLLDENGQLQGEFAALL
ncbi:hypothetical protein SPRG_05548 [Saprolegnia parasitica CBS 223.65]|uniref:Phytanoyl-CoA dioxygenase n=1 Tax=Saprolegnia parasitica (strain CBS 223.65) TaxID=695850 RepID=A0A067CK72_SAPPC|nr:hypothetical protein SPRG_05548 [Saprolegnia parasitica CBS 223.65]KDO29595.1 hypothetical protein SPRG_05548 [Saprolegnia parasitica CBS 223.65]|eukprot:XP_012199656.1 hypothetical protein SPRG_05548 [Saprolegnia parasitica CBS 223.65]